VTDRSDRNFIFERIALP